MTEIIHDLTKDPSDLPPDGMSVLIQNNTLAFYDSGNEAWYQSYDENREYYHSVEVTRWFAFNEGRASNPTGKSARRISMGG